MGDSQNKVAVEGDSKLSDNQTSQQRFGPRDLMALLRNLEKEIETYEALLNEENGKRENYRVNKLFHDHFVTNH